MSDTQPATVGEAARRLVDLGDDTLADARRIGSRRRWVSPAILASVLVLVAACGSSSASSGTATIVPVTPSVPTSPSPTATTPPAAAPSPTPGPTAKPTPNTAGVPSRISVADLDIDLPVIELPDGATPCNVALFWSYPGLVLPGHTGATYILANARDGMFLPLLTASTVKDGKAMIGMAVDVYTSTNWVFTYTISAVHRHVAPDRHAMDGPTSAIGPELWLQTGEGSQGTGTVIQIQAALTGTAATTESEAHPSPSPVACP